MKRTIAIGITAALLGACSPGKVGKVANVESAPSVLGEWQVASAYGIGAEMAENQPFITFQDSGKVVGNAGVNSFFGSYTTEGDSTLTFGGMGMTRMMGAPASMEVENAVKRALNAASAVRATGDSLVVLNAEGNEILLLTREGAKAVTHEMLAGEWNVVSACGIKTEGAERQPYLSFNDTVVGGNMGVNSFGGTYTLEGDTALKFRDLAMTEILGDDMTIENAVMEALRSMATIKSVGNSIVFLDANGKRVMVLKRR